MNEITFRLRVMLACLLWKQVLVLRNHLRDVSVSTALIIIHVLVWPFNSVRSFKQVEHVTWISSQRTKDIVIVWACSCHISWQWAIFNRRVSKVNLMAFYSVVLWRLDAIYSAPQCLWREKNSLNLFTVTSSCLQSFTELQHWECHGRIVGCYR